MSTSKKLNEYPFFSFLKPGTLIRFSRATKICAVLSALLFTFAGWQYFSGQWKYGIDFAGGLDLHVRFGEGVQTEAVRKALETAGIGEASIQALDSDGKMTGDAVTSATAASQPGAAEGAATSETAKAPEDKAAEPAAAVPEQKPETVAAGATPEGPADTAAASTETSGKNAPAGEIARLKGPEYLIKVKMEGDDIAERAAAVREALTKGFGAAGYEVLRQEGAGPAAVKDLSKKAVESVVYAMFFMFLYILVRFSQLDFASAVGFGTGAIVATLHDIVNVIALFVIFGYEFSLPALAAFLTVVGYSVNDTIVVYDRIRERLAKNRTADLWELYDQCASETLTRTIVTGGTTIMSTTALLLFGGGVIHDFAFVMLWGIIFGTYSSIFIASPVFIIVTKWLQSRQAKGSNSGKKAVKHARA